MTDIIIRFILILAESLTAHHFTPGCLESLQLEKKRHGISSMVVFFVPKLFDTVHAAASWLLKNAGCCGKREGGDRIVVVASTTHIYLANSRDTHTKPTKVKY